MPYWLLVINIHIFSYKMVLASLSNGGSLCFWQTFSCFINNWIDDHSLLLLL